MKMKERKKKIKPYYFLSTLSCIIILMFVVIAPANAGVDPDTGRSVGDAANRTAIIGETNLSFVNATGASIPSGKLKSTWGDRDIDISFPNEGNVFDSREAIKDGLAVGEYEVIGNNGLNTNITFRLPKLDVETKVSGGAFSTEEKTVTQGIDITFRAWTNLHYINGSLPNNISYKLIDPNGLQRRSVNGVSLMDIDVSDDGMNYLTINTSNLDELGKYTLSIETDPETNNGLDKEGPSVSFTLERVVKEEAPTYITIDAEPKKQTVTEKVVISANTSPNTNIILNVTSGRASKVLFRDDRGDVEVGGNSAFGKSDKNGDFKAAVYFNDTGSYEITATELENHTTDSVTVQIVYFSALVSTDKSKYYIGECVEITCSADAGDSITIKVDDKVIATDIAAPAKEFTYKWKTTEDVSPSSYELGIWVLPFSDPDKDDPDDSVSILFIRGGLSADLIYTGIEKETIQEIVAQGDDFEIKGTAPGRDNVDILTIAPAGGSGNGFDPTDISNVPGLTYSTSPVSDGAFTKKIAVGKGVDTGTYLVIALNPGRDKVYGNSNSSEILTVVSPYSLSIRTQAQILAILKEETINQAGNDDLLWVGTIEVENPWVTLNDIEDVHLGDDIVVSGVSNRKNGFPFLITVEGPTDLTPLFVYNDVSKKDTFSTDEPPFSTVSAKVGKYTVTVNDGDGYWDTKTVNILPAITPSFNISDTPLPLPAAMHEGEGTNESDTAMQAATPIPTPTRTPASTKTEAKKEPDFVLIFIIAGAGLLIAVSIARLEIVKRREQRGKTRKVKQRQKL